MYMWVSICLCCLLPVWPVFPLWGGTAQSSPRGRRGVCEQPPCPPSSCHITIRFWSRTANYVCVWQPQCQGWWELDGWEVEDKGWRMGELNPFFSCECMSVRVRHEKEDNFAVILGFTVKQKLHVFYHICLLFSQFKMQLIGYWWNTYWPKVGHLFIYLFNSSDETNWILMTLIQMMHLTSSVITDEVGHWTVNPGTLYLFSDSLTCLCTAIFKAALMCRPVSGLLEFQPSEVSLKQA